MNQRYQNHPFWGSHSPLSTLAGAGFLIMASSRTVFALVGAGALVWVYGLTVLVYSCALPVFPKKGKNLILTFLSAFLGSLYFLIITLTNPFLAIETALLVILAPAACIGSGVTVRTETLDTEDAVLRACREALVLGGLVFAFALIREPIGYGSLSVPGGARGIIELFGGEPAFLFPIRVIGGSAGALLLLGYGLALFRYYRNRHTGEES
jgi:hypothetical protein